ncbi:MAG: hypothetical protein RIT27_1104 [Pseudomonadota bacterium]|jgi:PAS domain S-box-containing protein
MADSLQHALFFSNCQTVFCIVGFEGSFRQINAACKKVLGYDQITLLKKEFLELVHLEDKKKVEKTLDDLSFSNEVKTFNCQILDAKGNYRDFVWQATPSLTEFAFYAVGIEIGDYKHNVLDEADATVREELAILQEKYNDQQLILEDLQQKVPMIGEEEIPITPLFGLVQEGIIFQHKNGKIYAINEIQVKHILGDIPSLEQFVTLWDVAKDYSNPEKSVKFSFVKKTGKLVHLYLCAQVIVDANKQIFGRAISFIDATEQYELEHKINALQEQTTLITQTHNEGILTWDLLSNEVNYSNSWRTLLGYRAQDNFFGKQIKAWYSRIHPTEYNQVIESLKCYIEGNCPKFESEHRLAHKDGSYRWMLVKGKALKDRSGRAYRFIGTFTDVTERRVIPETNEPTHLKENLIDVLPETVLCVEIKTHKIISANEIACQMYNYSKDDWNKVYLYQLYPDRLQFNREWQLMLKDKVSHIPVSFQKKKDGKTFAAEISGGYYEWKENLFLTLIIKDITQRRNLDQSIREERQQYGLAFHHAPFVILTKDRQGKIVKANRHAAKLLNKRPEQLVGLYEQDLKIGFSEQYYQADVEILSTGNQVLGIIEKLQDFHYHFDKIPYRDAAGNILGILVFGISVESHLSEQAAA